MPDTIPVTSAPTSSQTAAQIQNQIRNQKVPRPIQPTMPPPPLSIEKFSFRNVRGSRQKIRDAITGAMATDPKTGRRGTTPLDPAITQYLLYVLNNLEGDIFTMDAHVHSATAGEWMEHIHIKQWS